MRNHPHLFIVSLRNEPRVFKGETSKCLEKFETITRLVKCQISWILFSTKLSGYIPHRTVLINQSSSSWSTKWPLRECRACETELQKTFFQEAFTQMFFNISKKHYLLIFKFDYHITLYSSITVNFYAFSAMLDCIYILGDNKLTRPEVSGVDPHE